MSYQSETIAVAIGRINRQYFLPAIQRRFVWKPDQIERLFDSLMRGYPISSFLFWNLKPENRDKWQIYRFLERADQGGSRNELAETGGLQDLRMVLDGQQRLTSLVIGLRGRYRVKKKYKRKTTADAWSDQQLYLDLLSEPRIADDGTEDGLYYRFAFRESVPEPSENDHWFLVRQILDFDEREKFEAYIDALDEDMEAKGMARVDRRLVETNLKRLYEVVHKDETIAYYTEENQNYDRVLDIFVRANEGGTKLSKSDLLLSMVTASWGDINAREEIEDFVEHLNTGLSQRNSFDKDFVMKSCLALSDLPIGYKVENFSTANLERIRERFEDIQSALSRTVQLINRFGIDGTSLTSINALIPIACYLYRDPKLTLTGTSPFEVANADRVRRWLVLALVKGVFGRAADSLLTEMRAVIGRLDPAEADFPMADLNAVVVKTGLTLELTDDALDDILTMKKGGRQTFMALSLLYDEAAWGHTSHHQDHLFAHSHFKTRELKGTDRESWLDTRDHLANLCLLLDRENQQKSDKELREWLDSREPEFLKRHLIPADRTLWTFDQFDAFIEARGELIRTRLTERLNLSTGDSSDATS